ncbi:hypothetical protein IP92_01432 [Pseudoduganella flava]|uniref:Uncharacterized protein n=1 Tax=Pseudoduganella flava TaxID=871742 RepID=A0A562Q0N7_9BURK|nr:hypothetical protein [Pseudoduganella flava]QGZ38261.1 hypothetical protein GO485_03825 [Pseudoduganella flava]TWI50203.1 hypothetical protein IP92_01432 [Pseudoduganella flava]
MKRLICVSVMLLGGWSAPFAGADTSTGGTQSDITIGEPLVTARAKLLKHGWKPTRRHADDGYEYSGAEVELIRRRIFEVDSCSSDSSRCILFYAKRGKCLRMDTIGEKVGYMVVTRWAEECPDAPPRPSGANSE